MLTEVKAALRVTSSAFDADLHQLITAALLNGAACHSGRMYILRHEPDQHRPAAAGMAKSGL